MSYPKRNGSINRLREIPLALRIARINKLKEKGNEERNKSQPINRDSAET
jgi:hypothetical protein